MKQLSENSVEFNIQELQAHPDLLIKLLVSDLSSDVDLSINRHGNNIIVHKRTHNPKFVALMEKVREEVKQKKEEGYSREKAFQGFKKTHQEIIEQIYGK